MAKHALVTGGHGLVGRYVTRQLLASGDWKVTSTSRRNELVFEGAMHIPLDLMDRDSVIAQTPDTISHLFFAAFLEAKDRGEEAVINLAMLTNSIDALLDGGSPLEHIVLYEGGKAYGAHLGPFRIPARESDPRILGPLFYHDQEDALRQLSEEREVSFTVFRPDHILGVAFGGFVNLLHIIAVYAAVCKELGQPFRFPGPERAYKALVQLCDARLLARASEWAISTPAAANQVFNVTNGDLVRYCDLWPLIAEDFGITVADPMNYRLAESMPAQAKVWEGIVEQYDLCRVPISEMTNWAWADPILGTTNDIVSSTIKIRKAGFSDCIDSEESVLELLEEMRSERLIPTYS